MAKRREIRNSTAEFLIFQQENKEQGIEVMYADETIWCTQKAMAALFDVGVPAISKHLANVYETGELNEEATISKMETVQQEGNREVKRTVVMYKLDAIIAVGYRVNSIRATQFRQWATSVLRQFAIRGYVLDKKRMENGTFLSEDYFEHLLAEIHEIRLSKRLFYQKLTDIYATSMDYNKDAPTTRMFFKRVHNKYLKQMVIEDMERIVTAVLEFAESRAKHHIPMTMEGWAKYIDKSLGALPLEN